MSRTGTVNYHVHKPDRQAFEIDAGGVVGNLVSPELAETRIELTDVRDSPSSVEFARDGFAFANVATGLSDFDTDGWQNQYDREVTALLQNELGAKEVIIFDHTIRMDDPDADRRPARNVHSDYSPAGAERRLVDLLGAVKAAQWAQGHYAFINIWRPIGRPINSAPLGFVRPSTVTKEDWIEIDLKYPDRVGQIMGLAANARHEWVYRSRMTPDEVVYFTIYDNSERASVAHSAIDLVEDPNVTSIRKSVESRTLVRY